MEFHYIETETMTAGNSDIAAETPHETWGLLTIIEMMLILDILTYSD